MKFTDIVGTADMFVRNRVASESGIKNIRSEARKIPIEDLRDDGFKMIGIHLLMCILHLSHPLISSKSTKMRKFGE